MTASKTAKPFAFRYLSCRNISSPEDESAGRKVYSGHCPASSVLTLEDDENVREYLVDAPGKARRSPTLVHQAIRHTLNNNIDDFSILNGGMVLVARAAEVDDKHKVIQLTKPSIINGSQTQGELKRYFQKMGDEALDPSIKYELIITDDSELVAEISIARNFQNDVRAISIAGRRGQLDELETAVRRVHKGAQLRKSETDASSDDYLDTEKLIQVLFALMPDEVFEELGVSDSKVFTYSQKARCLKTFQRIVDEDELKAVYAYCLNMAGDAWTLYENWKSHQGFKGTRLRSIERDGGEIVDVPDGIIFPILASLSVFVKKKAGKWSFMPPSKFDESELIDTAATSYKEIADSNPWVMGKSKACYSTLHRVTSIYARLG
ncbi:MAG: AIPR family protein [Chiayiivirga sp.]|jgi:hypothetical protein|uniref:AIPR family protein n=1 Tax=Chiayiivirga sp. TaxID=2041042 RepID=UPI0025BB8671|nr:AIPR family protein [Chiayiivirga sp.]MCI1730511.1 AIPR family protein [Chiayiivirga sp.]